MRKFAADEVPAPEAEIIRRRIRPSAPGSVTPPAEPKIESVTETPPVKKVRKIVPQNFPTKKDEGQLQQEELEKLVNDILTEQRPEKSNKKKRLKELVEQITKTKIPEPKPEPKPEFKPEVENKGEPELAYDYSGDIVAKHVKDILNQPKPKVKIEDDEPEQVELQELDESLSPSLPAPSETPDYVLEQYHNFLNKSQPKIEPPKSTFEEWYKSVESKVTNEILLYINKIPDLKDIVAEHLDFILSKSKLIFAKLFAKTSRTATLEYREKQIFWDLRKEIDKLVRELVSIVSAKSTNNELDNIIQEEITAKNEKAKQELNSKIKELEFSKLRGSQQQSLRYLRAICVDGMTDDEAAKMFKDTTKEQRWQWKSRAVQLVAPHLSQDAKEYLNQKLRKKLASFDILYKLANFFFFKCSEGI